jgi:8-oxo-dGTP diphosphatase
MNTLLVVAAALINAKNEVLLAQRPAHKPLPGQWEFPGGKLEAGETPEQALVRELHEELGIIVDAKDCEAFWFLSHTYHDLGFHLMMPTWVVRRWQGEARALEHAAIAWLHPRNMHTLPMIEADDPLVARLLALVGQ